MLLFGNNSMLPGGFIGMICMGSTALNCLRKTDKPQADLAYLVMKAAKELAC